ncbi:hypothetical protein E5Q_03370 [Mixia osmundae IAM 14324]|uniref:Thioredoxin domain-containing protein n=1 Tax=Mixia osmundae (strain CBS 9802 / IAM 14324 / JCM 22182 / KY 12970) TaxID=764103 RepID=G7E1I9_MIXOS|nr:hypothetical protein E5Q_03370 [Mixia osmundae IAM 14324]
MRRGAGPAKSLRPPIAIWPATRDVASKYSVSAMPTFIVLKNRAKVDQVRGADKAALERAIKKHASGEAQSGPHAWGQGQSLGSSKPVSAPTADIANKIKLNLGGLDDHEAMGLGLLAIWLATVWLFA